MEEGAGGAHPQFSPWRAASDAKGRRPRRSAAVAAVRKRCSRPRRAGRAAGAPLADCKRDDRPARFEWSWGAPPDTLVRHRAVAKGGRRWPRPEQAAREGEHREGEGGACHRAKVGFRAQTASPASRGFEMRRRGRYRLPPAQTPHAQTGTSPHDRRRPCGARESRRGAHSTRRARHRQIPARTALDKAAQAGTRDPPPRDRAHQQLTSPRQNATD